MVALLTALLCGMFAVAVAEILYTAWAVREHLRGRIGKGTGVSEWKKASACSDTPTCVEVFEEPGGDVLVRDGENPDGPVLRFTPEEWAAFITGVKYGEFDTP